jgi:AcrR family transcriptional regulator
MSQSAAVSDARPYHHGDLRRALLAAARKIMEQEGPLGLSLRAVAREAGVSPAAPYHHFRDKAELMAAVAKEGFEALGLAMAAAREEEPEDALTAMGVAYVVFARENPTLYRVMTDCARDRDSYPQDPDVGVNPDRPYMLVRKELVATGALNENDEAGAALTTAALWCAVHGLAEMAGYDAFKPMIEEMGERAFYRAALAQIGQIRRA